MATPLVLFLTVKAKLSRADRRLIEQQVERHVGQYVQRYVMATIAGLEGQIRTLTDEMTILGERMTNAQQAESEKWAELGRVAGLIVAEVASLKDQVQRIGDTEAQADVERIDALLSTLNSGLPAEVVVPDVPVPAPGDPAVDPASGASSDQVVDGSAAPAVDSGAGTAEGAPTEGGV